MRELHDYKIAPTDSAIKVTVLDDPAPNGASRNYKVEHPGITGGSLTISFQGGPVNADGSGINGVTNEILLAILADRLRGFQTGPFACRENEQAITKIEEAQHWLNSRTLARLRRVNGNPTV